MSEESAVSVQVPAELEKIAQVVVQAVSDFKAGKGWQAIGVSALPGVISEMGSLDEIKAEFSSDKLAPFIGLTLGAVAGVYLAKATTTFLAKRKEKMMAKAPAIHAADGQVPAAHEVAHA